jgi:hypothetical protein
VFVDRSCDAFGRQGISSTVAYQERTQFFIMLLLISDLYGSDDWNLGLQFLMKGEYEEEMQFLLSRFDLTNVVHCQLLENVSMVLFIRWGWYISLIPNRNECQKQKSKVSGE